MMSRMLLFAVAVLFVEASTQSCQGPGFRINGCDLTKPILDDNRCGIAADGNPCPFGACCGENGQCGRSKYHCGTAELPAWGPPRDDQRCGVTYRYAGCQQGSICVGTYCVPQDVLVQQLKEFIPDGIDESGAAPSAPGDGGNSWASPDQTIPSHPTDPSGPDSSPAEETMDGPACQPNDVACPAPSSGKSGSGAGRGKDKDKEPSDFIEITETVEERDAGMKNSAAFGNLLSVILVIPSILIILQVIA